MKRESYLKNVLFHVLCLFGLRALKKYETQIYIYIYKILILRQFEIDIEEFEDSKK